MPDLLLELFSEEIPARMQAKAADDLRRLVTEKLVAEGLVYEGAKAFATPRRLALTVHGIPARQPDLKTERRGPKVGGPDAAVQGLGVVEGHGLECVLTLGTGVGCALFRNRRLLLHLELGQYHARRRKTYDQYIGQAALLRKGRERWNRRVRKVIDTVTDLTSCDVLYVGGGNARKLAIDMPPHVRIVSNTAGITGGIRLWEPELDELFRDEPMAQAQHDARQP